MKEFLAEALRMRVFQLSMAAVFCGLAAGGSFLALVVGASPLKIAVTLLGALIFALGIILYLCYQILTGQVPPTPGQGLGARDRVRVVGLIVALLPLLIGGVTGAYVLMLSRSREAVVVFIIGLLVSVVLYYLLARRA